MGLFGKVTTVEKRMPFTLILEDDREDIEAGIINLEMVGYVDGAKKYFDASFELRKRAMYENGDYEEMREALKHAAEQTERPTIKMLLNFRNDKLKSFQLDLEDLAKVMGDERFLQMSLCTWGFFDTPEERKELFDALQ